MTCTAHGRHSHLTGYVYTLCLTTFASCNLHTQCMTPLYRILHIKLKWCQREPWPYSPRHGRASRLCTKHICSRARDSLYQASKCPRLRLNTLDDTFSQVSTSSEEKEEEPDRDTGHQGENQGQQGGQAPRGQPPGSEPQGRGLKPGSPVTAPQLRPL